MIARLLVFTALLSAVRAEEWKVEGLPVPAELSLPENHDPAKKWPAVFFYHGTNGHPATHMIRQQTGPRDWIVVGMTYSTPGQFTYTPENLERELVILRRTRDGLAAKHGLDPKRLYVSGFSMGGWMSGYFFQAERSLAGAVILGAGHMNAISPKLAPFPPGTPLFVGVGRLDGNYPFALRARLFYNKLGPSVTMETWDGLGHEFPKEGSPALKEWFALRAGGQPDGKATEAEFQQIGKLPVLEQWRRLLEFRERPYVTAPGQPWKETVAKRIAELESDPEVSGEAKIYKRHRQLLADEANAVTVPDLEKVNNGYGQLAAQAGNSPQARLIGSDFGRVSKLLESFEAQRAAKQKDAPKPVEPNFPKPDRQIPKNPMVR